VEPREGWGRIGADDSRTEVPPERGAYPDYYAGIARALRDRTPPPVDPLDAVAGLEIIEAARLSAAERRIVALPRAG
jgi:predicted dehydrogenase